MAKELRLRFSNSAAGIDPIERQAILGADGIWRAETLICLSLAAGKSSLKSWSQISRCAGSVMLWLFNRDDPLADASRPARLPISSILLTFTRVSRSDKQAIPPPRPQDRLSGRKARRGRLIHQHVDHTAIATSTRSVPIPGTSTGTFKPNTRRRALRKVTPSQSFSRKWAVRHQHQHAQRPVLPPSVRLWLLAHPVRAFVAYKIILNHGRC